MSGLFGLFKKGPSSSDLSAKRDQDLVNAQLASNQQQQQANALAASAANPSAATAVIKAPVANKVNLGGFFGAQAGASGTYLGSDGSARSRILG